MSFASDDFVQRLQQRVEKGDVELFWLRSSWLHKKAMGADFGTHCCEMLNYMDQIDEDCEL